MLDIKTDFVPEVITETIPTTLSGVGGVIEAIPDTVADGMAATVTRTRRLLRLAPWSSGTRMTRRRWLLLAATVGVVAALVAVVIDRRPDHVAQTADESDPSLPSPARRVA